VDVMQRLKKWTEDGKSPGSSFGEQIHQSLLELRLRELSIVMTIL
jgi:hypothetical protein